MIILFIILGGVALLTPIAIFLASTAKECVHCKEILHPEATACAHCGGKVAPTVVKRRPTPQSSMPRLLYAILGVFAVFVAFLLALFVFA